MNKIIIYAYTRLNLGDDLFIKILCDRYPKQEFIIITCKKYSEAFKNIKNLRCYNIDSIKIRIINFILKKFDRDNYINRLKKKCNIAITIGGSLFMQEENWEKNSIELYNRLDCASKSFLLGSNFGPFNDQKYLIYHKELFSKYEDICFRDSYSYNLFNDLSNVRLASDIVFSLKNKNKIKRNDTVLISVIKPSARKKLREYDNQYYNKIKDISIGIIEKGYKVKLLSFCKDEGDEEAIENILKILPKKYINNTSKYFYNGNIDEILKIISESNSIIATRFHAMILGLVYKKNIFPILYSDKMKNVINDLDSNLNYIEIRELNKMGNNEILGFIDKNPINIDKEKINAKNHFLKLDKHLINIKN